MAGIFFLDSMIVSLHQSLKYFDLNAKNATECFTHRAKFYENHSTTHISYYWLIYCLHRTVQLFFEIFFYMSQQFYRSMKHYSSHHFVLDVQIAIRIKKTSKTFFLSIVIVHLSSE
jgi:hypothetical protein